jgi:hypothetical protein
VDKAEKRRWAILLSLLVITLIAIAYPLEEKSGARSPVIFARPADKEASATPILPADAKPAADAPAPQTDPFAPRNWQAAPSASVTPQSVALVSAEPAPAPAPAGPPPLPFCFAGRLNDGVDQVIYLTRGDQVLVARNGETLEGTYKVLAVEARRIEFMHLPSGEKQTLALPVTENN